MKKWSYQQEPLRVVETLPDPVPEKEVSPVSSMPWLECSVCTGKATILFEGTSYCRSCLAEKIRTGTL